MPESVRHRFCGVHFFNPPRYMHLVELIACRGTEPAILDNLEKFLVTTLGKGVIATAQTGIPNSVDAGSMVSGYPAIPNRDWLKASAIFRMWASKTPMAIDGASWKR